jgi:hypothetical protein
MIFRALLALLALAPALAAAVSRDYDGDWSLTLSCDGDVRTSFPKGVSFKEKVRIADGRFSFTRREAAGSIAFAGELQGNEVRLVGQGPETRTFPQRELAQWALSGKAADATKFALKGGISGVAFGWGGCASSARGNWQRPQMPRHFAPTTLLKRSRSPLESAKQVHQALR